MTTAREEKDHWDKGAKSYSSNNYTKEIIKLLIAELPQGRTLEIGAGQGRLTSELVKRTKARGGYSVYGIDISRNMLASAPSDNVEYKVNDGRTIPYPDNYFNNIYSVTVFQHIPYGAKLGYIQEAARTLKKGGVFLIQFVDGTYSGDFDHNILAIEMDKLLRDNGFKVEKIQQSNVHPQWTWIKGVKI
jgi:ubiquinone/menaquinone biosynthesis C-methylase UbiE